ncbi:hypothetical protein, partial [Enterobacter cloacae]|uniref:hypothetical protein n=1 Tax=Enterobacter cloacae TaxID=550 RepID=UPI0039C1BD26
KRAYCLKTQPATGETYPKSDLFNKADPHVNGGGDMLPGLPVCYWGFTHLIPRDKITLRPAD